MQSLNELANFVLRSVGHPAAQKWFEGEKKAVGRHWRRRRSEFSFSLSLDAPEALPRPARRPAAAARPATAMGGIRRMAKPKGDIGY